MKVDYVDDTVVISAVDWFEPCQIFECGQCFRFNRNDDGSYCGVAHKKLLNINKQNGKILLYPCNEEDFNSIWRNYFDFDRDYAKIMSQYKHDEFLAKGIKFAHGVRILNQHPFETLISFIISANNNIGRIKGIIERLSRKYGDEIEANNYAFPEPEQLACATEDELVKLGAGYRASYILKSAQMALDYDFNMLRQLEYKQAKKELLKFPGVGPKVADCILLFSLGFSRAFPVDVWVKRVMEIYLGPSPRTKSIETFVNENFGEYAGFAQQCLFFYARESGLGRKQDK